MRYFLFFYGTPAKSFGLEFNPSESELFRSIPTSVLESKFRIYFDALTSAYTIHEEKFGGSARPTRRTDALST